MNAIIYIICLLLGAGLAFVFLKTQSWSVKSIQPESPRFSKWLIIGGAFIRWVIIFFIFLLVLSFSITALLMTFSAFMISRMFFLLRWQGILEAKQEQTR